MTLPSTSHEVFSKICESLGLNKPPVSHGGYPKIRVVFQPGWESDREWALTVYQPLNKQNKEEFFIELVKPESSISAEVFSRMSGKESQVSSGNPIIVRTTRKDLDQELSKGLIELFESSISLAKFQKTPVQIHADTFSFFSYSVETGPMCAEVKSCFDGSVAQFLISIANDLADFVDEPNPETAFEKRKFILKKLDGFQ